MIHDIDRTIVKKAIKGNKNALEKLIIKYEKKVYNIAYQIFGNEHDANDMAQEVFIKVYKSLHKFNFKSTFSTWIYRITVNTCIDEYRKKSKNSKVEYMDETIKQQDSIIQKQFIDKGLTPEEEIIKNENIKFVRESIDELKEDYRIIIILRDIKGYSYENIADILDISIGTVKSRISRARSKLKKIIKENQEQNINFYV